MEQSRFQSPAGEARSFPTPSRPAEPGALNPVFEDYLDHIYAPLVGKVPYKRRQELRAELRGHLETLAEAHQELGSTPEEAAQAALRQFGNPRGVGAAWGRAWSRGTGTEAPWWRAAGIGLACFTPVAVRLWFAIGSGQRLTEIDPFLIAFILPLLCGALCGVLARRWQMLGACVAVAVNTLVSMALAYLLGALEVHDFRESAMVIPLLMFIGWMPCGCLAAALAGWIRDRVEASRYRPALQ